MPTLIYSLLYVCTSLLLFLNILSNFVFNISGIDTNETIKVFGGGGADPDRDHHGDLYVTIKVINSIAWKLEVAF